MTCLLKIKGSTVSDNFLSSDGIIKASTGSRIDIKDSILENN